MEPSQRVREALERGGYEPRGADQDFRARCPAHKGGNSSALRVFDGADGRVHLHCYAHDCSLNQILAGMGLRWADLFPGGTAPDVSTLCTLCGEPGDRYPNEVLYLCWVHAAARGHKTQVGKRRNRVASPSGRKVLSILAQLDTVGEPWRVQFFTTCQFCGKGQVWATASSHGGLDLVCSNGCRTHAFTQALAGRAQLVEEQGGRKRGRRK